jgi:hypothetical protein
LIGGGKAALGLQLVGATAPTGRVLQRGNEPVALCAPSGRELVVRVDLEQASDVPEPYLLAVVDDGEAGFSGALRAAELLDQAHRPGDARKLLDRAIASLPHAPGAEAARARRR